MKGAEHSDDSADDDVRSFMDGVARELDENAPIKCAITFHWCGNEELAAKVQLLLQIHAILMRRRHPWLAFNYLESIVFHHDYTEALRDVSTKAGRQHLATSEESGIGVAMVVPLADHCVLVMDADIALTIASCDDETIRDSCIEMVMHELCHAHDFGRKRELLGHEFLKLKLEGLSLYTFPAAEAAWNEYFANKYCTSEASSPDMHPKYLSDVVPDVVRSIKSEITAYRTHERLDEVLDACSRKVRFLFQCLGYAAGRLVATGASLRDVAPESEEVLAKTELCGIWSSVILELQRLDAARDQWTSFDEFGCLMDLVLEAYGTLGLHFSESGGQARVDIPYTEETTPVFHR